MNITLNVPALSELAKSIDNLANAMANTTTPMDGAEKLRAMAHTTAPTLVEKFDKELGAPPVETPPTTEMTPSEKAKAVISEEIIALGGTPPEKGSVKKFEDALADLKVLKTEEPPIEVETPEEPPVEVETAVESAANTLENTRMLAAEIIKNSEVEGKKSLLGCLKDVGAKSITLLFDDKPESVDTFVEALLEHTNKTLAEIVVEAKANA